MSPIAPWSASTWSVSTGTSPDALAVPSLAFALRVSWDRKDGAFTAMSFTPRYVPSSNIVFAFKTTMGSVLAALRLGFVHSFKVVNGNRPDFKIASHIAAALDMRAHVVRSSTISQKWACASFMRFCCSHASTFTVWNCKDSAMASAMMSSSMRTRNKNFKSIISRSASLFS